MDIILRGQQSGVEAIGNLARVLKLFKDRYRINSFCEIHLSVTLMDEQGDIVELVDNKTNQVYRLFEVYRNEFELTGQEGSPFLKLVVDNTK